MKDMEPRCIGEILLHQTERSPDRIAVTFGEEKCTYKQLLSTTAALQLKIEDRVREGEVVVICLPNSPAYIHAYFAVTLLGAVIMPLYSGSSEAEIRLACRTVDAALCITTHEMKSKLRIQNLSVLSQEDWQAPDEETKPIYRPRLADEVALMLQTSGTTGNPKIVQHTHHSLITNVKAHCESLSLTEKDTVLITLPMPFGYCNTSQFLSHLYLGGELVIMTGLFLPSSFMKTMQEQDITVVTAVPTMLQALSLLKSDYKALPHLRYICFGEDKSRLTYWNLFARNCLPM